MSSVEFQSNSAYMNFKQNEMKIVGRKSIRRVVKQRVSGRHWERCSEKIGICRKVNIEVNITEVAALTKVTRVTKN